MDDGVDVDVFQSVLLAFRKGGRGGEGPLQVRLDNVSIVLQTVTTKIAIEATFSY